MTNDVGEQPLIFRIFCGGRKQHVVMHPQGLKIDRVIVHWKFFWYKGSREGFEKNYIYSREDEVRE